MKNHQRSLQMKKKRIKSHLEKINLFAAGIDIGSHSHYVAVPEDLDTESVKEFASFTGELNKMADWLVSIGILTVAMESTGIYWIPAYEILAERGITVLLVNAHHIKNVSGRKSDVMDCQWIQQLHTYGLLNGAFRPEEETVALRSYMRQRETLTQQASDYIRRMQKALRQMNLLLDNVVSDIDGVTGMKIIRAILDGERNPETLAKLRDGRCKKDEKTIAASLEGHYQEVHLFSLKQSLELYDTYQEKIIDCDVEIQKHLQYMLPEIDKQIELPDLDNVRRSKKSKNCPTFDVRGELYQLTGVDLTAIDGLEENSVLKILSETGVDMSYWPTEKQFCSW